MNVSQIIIKGQPLVIVCLLMIAMTTIAQIKNSTMQFNYAAAWKNVKDFEDKGLPESALKVVEGVYEAAKKDGNAAQLVKAVIHQLKFTDYKEENAFVLNLRRLREEAERSSFPVKPVLHSMLGEMYWQYYQNNRHRFLNRTTVAGQNEQDIETWNLEKIVSETFLQYNLSLSDVEKSKATTIDVYEDVLEAGNAKGRRFRPTLYDFLAHRALAFASNDESSITKPAYAFNIDDPKYFGPSPEFAAIKIATSDSLSMKHFALVLYQELIEFHSKDKDPEALTDVDIDRLAYVKENYNLPDKTEQYYKALNHLETVVIKHPVSTRVTFLKAMIFNESASFYKPLQSEKHKWDFKTALAICDSAIARFKDSEGGILCENLQVDIRSKSMSAVIEENNVPDLPFRSLVRYKNFIDLHYRIVKISRDEVRAQRRKWEKDYNVDREQKFIEYFVGKTAVRNGKFALPDDGDFQEHGVEVKLDGLPVGEYMVLYSNRPDFNVEDNKLVYAFTTITNISYVHRNTYDGGTDCFVIHRQNGSPLAGAIATVYASDYNYQKNSYESVKLGSFTADAKGYFHVGFIRKANQRNFFFEFTLKDDKKSSEPIDHQRYYGGSIGQYKVDDPKMRVQTHIFLDRSIYRPGQPIYFKGLVVNTDGKTSTIVAGHKTKLSLYDVNDQIKGEVSVTTNDYGTYSGTFTAPSSGLTGVMRIQDSENTGTVSFSVEEYKRPKFEVVFDTLDGSFKLNDTVKVSGIARAYSGAAIDGATVSYRVVRIANFPFWWWYRWGYNPPAPEMEVTQGETKTDVTGKFNIDFAAIPDLSIDSASDPTFSYTVYADVTDINGETHSHSTTVSIGYKSLLLSVPLTNINLDELPAVAKEIPITTTNLAGKFEAAQGKISIWSLKMPERTFRARLWEQPDKAIYTKQQSYQYFPLDLFDDEGNKYKWEHGKVVFTSAFNTATKRSFTLNDLKSWTPGEYVLEVTAQDNAGREVKEVVYFTVFSPKANKIPTPAVSYFQPVSLVTEPGNMATFSAGTSEKEMHVLYELEQNGKILSSKWIKLGNEQRFFEIPVLEEYRGNIGIHWTFIKGNRLYTENHTVTVPYTNKALNITFQTFRDKLLPGQQEQWKILIKGEKADKVAAEMVAVLYDESLDSFKPHSWYASLFSPQPTSLDWQSANGFNRQDMIQHQGVWYIATSSPETAEFDNLNWFDYSFYGYRNMRFRAGAGVPMPMMKKAFDMDKDGEAESSSGKTVNAMMETVTYQASAQVTPDSNKPAEDFSQVPVRKNFNETAFFYPHLMTNDSGEIIINFTVPEALTRWKMLGFAHTKNLKSGFTSNQLVTQKELMVVPNQPRFFREGDKMTFSVKVSSLVDVALDGQAQLEFFDPLTSKAVNLFNKDKSNVLSFALPARQSKNLEWNIEIPEGLQALSYRVVAKAGNFSDGEEMTIPVLTNRMLVTETLPLPIRGKQSKDFKFEKLIANGSPTLRHQRFTLEFTSNPAWYAIQALPYLMEYPYDCVEQTFSKFYANSIAAHIANSNPRIKTVFDTWKNIQPDALLSNLEKNQELKSALLEETPWVLQANNETARKRNVGLLFDLNKMANEREKALEKVAKAQTSNGGFSWFPGFPEDRYMTQHIISSMGHLDVMGVTTVRTDERSWTMIDKAIAYLDHEISADYTRLKAQARKKEIKLEDKHIGYLQIQYLYTRSYFTDVKVNAENMEAFQYFLGQAKKYWLSNNLYVEGMSCLALHRFGEREITASMIKSFTERALRSEEMGMYWKSERGFYWYQAPVETQALMIEVFDEVAGDLKSVEELKVWLLKQKQTQDWKTTKATTEACYALLRRGSDVLANTTQVDITVGNEKIDPSKRNDSRVEAGTGYFKTAWQANEIKASMGKIHVEKRDEGVAWGAVYWQYFEQLDKITTAETPLQLKKELFKQSNTPTGPVISSITPSVSLMVGDLVKVRIELRADRDMEYVHLKDMRAAGFEPVSTLSTYRFQDGLYYYESTRDLATNFFMGYLPKGTYVFEYALRVSQKGDFSNGITTIQCMYAPEFSAHSSGIRVNVK